MLLSTLTWWYTAGWSGVMDKGGRRIAATLETFSVALLLGSLFQPFRQISAGQVNGGLDVQMKAFGDRLFSRIFGTVIRSLFILMGVVGALLMTMVALLQIAAWPLIPLMPLIGAGLALVGWTP